MSGRHSLAGAHIGVAVAAFGVASAMGVLQALSLADFAFPYRSESLYYISVTAHGVLMALVFTTFFIMGLGYMLAQEQLGRIIGKGWAWFAYLAGAGRNGRCGGHHSARQEHGPLHVLSAAAGAPAVLHRRDAAR